MKLNENYSISKQLDEVILHYRETKEETIINPQTKTLEGTGKMVQLTEDFIFPTLEEALKAYLIKNNKKLGTGLFLLSILEKIVGFFLRKKLNK